MRRALLLLWILLVLDVPIFGHLSFNIVVDGKGHVYFLDVFSGRLMEVTSEGRASELVDFWQVTSGIRLHSLGIDTEGNLYAAGHREERIWRVTPSGAVSTAYPREGHAPLEREILHVGVDASGVVFFMDWTYGARPGEGQRFRLFRLAPSRGEPVRLFACEEGARDFLDFHVGSMTLTGGGTPYFSNAHRIWKLDPERELVLVAGSSEKGHVDGPAEDARFDRPHGMTVDGEGNLLVAELSGRLRRVGPGGVVTTLGGGAPGYEDGPAEAARFDQCFGVAVGPGGRLFVGEYAPGKEYRIRVLSGGRVRTLSRIPSDGTFRK